MGYQISYENGGSRKSVPDKPVMRKRKRIVYVFILSVAIAFVVLLQNKSTRRYFLPGNPTVTEAAIENFVESIQSGAGIGDAVTTFCREVIEGAG